MSGTKEDLETSDGGSADGISDERMVQFVRSEGPKIALPIPPLLLLGGAHLGHIVDGVVGTLIFGVFTFLFTVYMLILSALVLFTFGLLPELHRRFDRQ